MKKIVIIGNPNVGKSTLFNLLTGLKQKTGNYPGITIEKKSGEFSHQNETYEIIDLPGTYSLYPSSLDEEIVLKSLTDKNNPDYPDLVIVVSEPLNLKRNLLLTEQIMDLKIPTLLVINMIDEAGKKGILIDIDKMNEIYGNSVVQTNARKNIGIEVLKNHLGRLESCPKPYFHIPHEYQDIIQSLSTQYPSYLPYQLWLFLSQTKPHLIPEELREVIFKIQKDKSLIPRRLQVKETIDRYKNIDGHLTEFYSQKPNESPFNTNRIDYLVTHPVMGYLIFFIILFSIFQALFYLAEIPMNLIENVFSKLSEYLQSVLGTGPLAGLITEGLIPGIGGILIFIPQIAILFLFLTLMEESGYMSRVVYLMDRWMKPAGLSGKSVVPLISGVACAIPAILSARNIENSKERLLTILVTPFMTCSARLPVYAIIISMVIPRGEWWLFNYQGLALMLLYLAGFFMAILSSFILKHFIHTNYKSYLILDMPNYKVPIWRNVFYTIYSKSMDFIIGAGKIILAVSILIWALGNYGPGDFINTNENNTKIENTHVEKVTHTTLENSFLGIFGKKIEPLIKPLGYDWKIGIGIISSFAAREVFVPTMATIYSIQNEDDHQTLTTTMKNEVNGNTNEPTFNFASGISLLIFYAFAMQCLSTLAVVKKETHSWKWPLFQLIFMTGIAYILALIAYQTLN